MPDNSVQAQASHRLEGVNNAAVARAHPSKASEMQELDKAIHLDYGALVCSDFMLRCSVYMPQVHHLVM